MWYESYNLQSRPARWAVTLDALGLMLCLGHRRIRLNRAIPSRARNR